MEKYVSFEENSQSLLKLTLIREEHKFIMNTTENLFQLILRKRYNI